MKPTIANDTRGHVIKELDCLSCSNNQDDLLTKVQIEIVLRKKEVKNESCTPQKKRIGPTMVAELYRKLMMAKRKRAKSAGINNKKVRQGLQVVGIKGNDQPSPVKVTKPKEIPPKTSQPLLRLRKTGQKARQTRNMSSDACYGTYFPNTTSNGKSVKFLLSGRPKPLLLVEKRNFTGNFSRNYVKPQTSTYSYYNTSIDWGRNKCRRQDIGLPGISYEVSPEGKRRSVFSRGFLNSNNSLISERSELIGYFGL